MNMGYVHTLRSVQDRATCREAPCRRWCSCHEERAQSEGLGVSGMRSSRSDALAYAVPAEVRGEGLHPLSGGKPAATSLGRLCRARSQLHLPATVTEAWRALNQCRVG